MGNFDKMYDIKRVMSRVVTEHDLISALFKDIPELMEFSWSVTSEYDDNNYSNYTTLTSVNGRRVNYEAEYDEDYAEENEQSAMPLLSSEARNKVQELVYAVGEYFGFGEDHTAIRQDYFPDMRGNKHAKAEDEEIEYVSSYMNQAVLPDEYFRNLDNPKWATYYAMDHGRFSPELEFKIYAQEGRMWFALQYARCIGSRLVTELENYFILNAGEEDKEHLQIYMNEFVEKSLSEIPC